MNIHVNSLVYKSIRRAAERQASRIARAARDGDIIALRQAIADGHEEIDSRIQGSPGLHLAILFGHVEVALTLIAAGADASLLDDREDSPLALCSLSNSLSAPDSARIAKALLLAGADPSRVGPSGHSPLDYARIRGKMELADCLSQER